MSRNNGFYAEQLKSAKIAARFEHCDENVSKLLDDKDSKNTQNKDSKGRLRRITSSSICIILHIIGKSN